LLLLPISGFAAAPVFLNSGASLPNVGLGSVAWGDYQNDGNLDILLAGNSGGSPVAQLLANEGGTTFSAVSLALPGLDKCSIAWGDYDNDGNLDILISGVNQGLLPQTQVWHNQGNGTFINANITLNPLGQGAAIWADLNNDGKPDIILTGTDENGQATTEVYQNLGNGSFALVSTALPNVTSSSVAVADLGNTGYLDVIITGIDGSGNFISQIWHNLGGFNFTNVSVPFIPVSGGSVAVGDFNNDGLVDILLTGFTSSGKPATELWRNNGSFSFTQIANSLPSVCIGAAAFGDFDNDGILDVVVAGSTGGLNYVCQVFKGVGDGTFVNASIGATGLADASVACGDFNNDGRLDFLVAGFNSGYFTQLWENQTPQANTPPTAPGGLASTIQPNGATIGWNAATDAQTPSAGLSYNIRIGTTPGGIDIVAPNANLSTGFRKAPQLGNAQERLFSVLNLPPGTYYWSVQSIDSAFAGSPFAPEATFVIDAIVNTAPATSVAAANAVLNGTVNPLGLNTQAWFQWGTTTDYGNTTTPQGVGNATSPLGFTATLIGLQSATTYHYRLAASDSAGTSYGADQTFTTLGNTPPSISPLNNVTVGVGSSTGPIPITLSDIAVPPAQLVLTAMSSSTNLVPATDIVLGGSGANRTLTITSAPGQAGEAVISVGASDGVNSAWQHFVLNVGSSSSSGLPGDVDGVGYIDQNDLNGVLSNYWPNAFIKMTNTTFLGGGVVQFALTNLSSWDFTVMTSSDMVNWSPLPTKAYPVFQFVDPQSTNGMLRFYRLSFP
jgi:hypothetical protein